MTRTTSQTTPVESGRPNAWINSIRNADWYDRIAWMTLFVVLLVAHTVFYQVFAGACLIAATIWRSARRSPWIWLTIVAVFTPRLLLDWYDNEDHVYLTIYWCTALALGSWGPDTRQVIAWNARLLVGLAFLFATAWKLASPAFYDGSLCTYKLLYDYRFRTVMTEPLCGLSSQDVDVNQTAMISLTQTGSRLDEVSLEYPDRVIWLAKFLAGWTILIEGTLAVVFLLPPTWVRSFYRHTMLIVFSLTTYLVVPVLGFGLLFMTMGYAQTSENEARFRRAYLATSWLLLLRFGLIA